MAGHTPLAPVLPTCTLLRKWYVRLAVAAVRGGWCHVQWGWPHCSGQLPACHTGMVAGGQVQGCGRNRTQGQCTGWWQEGWLWVAATTCCMATYRNTQSVTYGRHEPQYASSSMKKESMSVSYETMPSLPIAGERNERLYHVIMNRKFSRHHTLPHL